MELRIEIPLEPWLSEKFNILESSIAAKIKKFFVASEFDILYNKALVSDLIYDLAKGLNKATLLVLRPTSMEIGADFFEVILLENDQVESVRNQ